MNITHKIFSYIHIDDWSNLQQFIGCLAVGTLLVIFGYGSDINFLQKKLHAKYQQVATTATMISNEKQLLQQNNLSAKNSPLLTINKTINPNQDPINFVVIDILNSLEQARSATQIESYLFEPQAVRENWLIATYPVKLEVEGEYNNLFKFINHILSQPHLIVIEELVIQKKMGNNVDNLNMQLLLTCYREKKAVIKDISRSVTNEIFAIALPKRDIFRKADVGMNLFLWSTQELSFLGLIKEAQKTLGIVSDPLGRVYQITVGDKIGLNQSKVTMIDDHGVTTTNSADNIYRGE